MNDSPNCICLHDNTAAAVFLWISESIRDILGYEAHELIGTTSYVLYHPQDVAAVRRLHATYHGEDGVAVLFYLRLRHKDGSWVNIEGLYTSCYNILLGTLRRIRPKVTYTEGISGIAEEAARVDENGVQIIGWNESDPHYHELLDQLQQPFEADIFKTFNFEPRVCLLLDQKPNEFKILFASDIAYYLLGYEKQEIIGNSISNFIHPNDLNQVYQNLILILQENTVTYISFEFMAKNPLDNFHVEGMASSSDDGISMMLRKRQPNLQVCWIDHPMELLGSAFIHDLVNDQRYASYLDADIFLKPNTQTDHRMLPAADRQPTPELSDVMDLDTESNRSQSGEPQAFTKLPALMSSCYFQPGLNTPSSSSYQNSPSTLLDEMDEDVLPPLSSLNLFTPSETSREIHQVMEQYFKMQSQQPAIPASTGRGSLGFILNQLNV